MFCCSPGHMELSVARSELDFENSELYSTKFTEIIKSKGTKHTLTKHSSLKIDSKLNCEFKVGHDKHSQFLFEVCDASREVQLTSIDSTPNAQNLWRVLSQKETHQLQIGDRIKIGFTELLVYSSKLLDQQSKESVQLNCEQHCRYCLLNTYTSADPLVNLCKCNGSVKYLHLSCLRNWAMMKIQKQDRENVQIYTINKLECELCKSEWPKQVLVDGTMQGLLDFDSQSSLSQSFFNESEPFIVLETDSLDEEELEIKVFIKIFLSNKFYFGDHEDTSDLAIQTIGVSPIHCYLHVQNNQFYITDCGSKTGTLVTMHQEEMFTNKRSIYLQYSHLFVKIGLEEPFFSCFAPEQQYRLKLIAQNLDAKK